jgi:hypothetical protein
MDVADAKILEDPQPAPDTTANVYDALWCEEIHQDWDHDLRRPQ